MGIKSFSRGFRRVSFITLPQELDPCSVVRLTDDVHVECGLQLRVSLRHALLCQGCVLDLGVIPQRANGSVRAHVIGCRAPGAHEPWWLATLEPLPQVVSDPTK